MFRFEKLEIWIASIEFAKKVYIIADGFPKNELFGLSSQLKRAVISISSNIAEGSGSSTIKDYSHFLDISIKSTFETVSQLMLAQELKFIDEKTLNSIYNDAEILIKRIIVFKKSLNKK